MSKQEYLEVEWDRLKPFTTKWTASENDVASGVMLDILGPPQTFRGKGLSKTIWPAPEINFHPHHSKNDYAEVEM